MKTTFLKHGFFYIFIFLCLTVSFNGCSSNDNDDNIAQTFLEKYDGTTWVYIDEFTVYIRINNNTNKFIEQWFFEFEDECYYYEFDSVSENTEIIKNSNDNLVFKYTENGDTETVTVTREGETLKAVIQEGGEDEILFLNETSVNVDGLEICN